MKILLVFEVPHIHWRKIQFFDSFLMWICLLFWFEYEFHISQEGADLSSCWIRIIPGAYIVGFCLTGINLTTNQDH